METSKVNWISSTSCTLEENIVVSKRSQTNLFLHFAVAVEIMYCYFIYLSCNDPVKR